MELSQLNCSSERDEAGRVRGVKRSQRLKPGGQSKAGNDPKSGIQSAAGTMTDLAGRASDGSDRGRCAVRDVAIETASESATLQPTTYRQGVRQANT
jgi:hypothetical protein